MSDRKRIAVVATAAKETGAWQIVNEFARVAEADPRFDYIFITTRPLRRPGLKNLVVGTLGAVKRMFLELFFLPWLTSKGVGRPDIVLSLNSLGVLGALGCRQFVYVHQALPFYPEIQWPLTGGGKTMIFYQRYFGWIMWLSILLTSAKVIVQTETMVLRVKRRWGIDAVCWFPDFQSPPECAVKKWIPETLTFFYPATFHEHKNHFVLAEALKLIKAQNPSLYNQIRIVFTVPEDCRTEPYLDKGLSFLGQGSFETVVGLYGESAALVFPSRVETIGLPLVEAMGLGIPVLCADQEYAREILSGYEGVRYVSIDDAQEWADVIMTLAEHINVHGHLLRHQPHKPNIQSLDFGKILI